MNDDWLPRAALGVLRIITALQFLEHGTAKIFGFPRIPIPALRMGSPIWLSGAIEIIAAPLLLIGLFTRPVAFIAAGEMAVAYWFYKVPKAFFPIQSDGDAAILFCFVFLLLAAAGPGEWSVDGVRSRRHIGTDRAIA